jgi:hypothetical protein
MHILGRQSTPIGGRRQHSKYVKWSLPLLVPSLRDKHRSNNKTFLRGGHHVPLLVRHQIDAMGHGEHHVASPEGRYGSAHSTISDNENTGSRIKDIRVLSSPVFRTHFLGPRSPLPYSRLGFSIGERRANK